MALKRCDWVGNDPLMVRYHDTQWGVPLHDDLKLFEFMILDAFQAGLSWRIVLNKRAALGRALDNFDPVKIAKYNEKDVAGLLANEEIIRNRQKLLTTVNNARQFLAIKQNGSFDTYIWKFVNGKPIVNNWENDNQIPTVSTEAEAMSNELKARGFKFVGPTICYAFMQAAGLVNDHTASCFRHKEVSP